MKAFKYFDMDGSGECSPEEFKKALEKVGITFKSHQEMMEIFSAYDSNKNGELDYKEFSSILLNKPGGQGPGQVFSQDGLMDQLRKKLKSRGAIGTIGLARQFKIMDDNNSRSLDINEFTKAVTDYGLGFSKEQIKSLYGAFDINRDGSVDYDEFLRQICGEMNARRKKLVQQAFNKLDKDGSGVIDLSDIKGVYNASKHPDVTTGKKTEDEILREFLKTFEVHHNTMNDNASDGEVTLDEFMEYYNNISASIGTENDQYFEVMMQNAWKLGDNNKGYAKGWGNGEPGCVAFKKAPRPSKPYPQELMQPVSTSYGNQSPSKGYQYEVGDRAIDLIIDKFR